MYYFSYIYGSKSPIDTHQSID